MAAKKTPIKEVTEEVSVENEVIEVPKAQGGYDPMEPIKAFYFKDNEKYKNDIFVGYNGRTYMVKRGVEVTVPRVVDEIIRQSMSQDLASAEYQERLQQQYRRDSEKYV